MLLSVVWSLLAWIFPGGSDCVECVIRPSIEALILWIGFVGLFLWFMVAHRTTSFVGWLFYVQMGLGMVYFILLFTISLVRLMNYWTVSTTAIPILIGFAALLIPIVISIHRPASFKRCIKSVVPFYLFFPTLVIWFGSYSVVCTATS